MQDKVKGDLGERRVKAASVDRRRIGRAPHLRDQAVAGGEGKVVVQVGVTVYVDLRRQLAVVRCRNEEMNMRWTVPVPTKLSMPGTGRLFVASIEARDFPVMLAIGMLIVVGVVMMNLLADISYEVVNPQIRHRS
jgi:hypothetical protein